MINDDNYTELGIVYNRQISDGQTFTIEGNFFKIDISNKLFNDKNTISIPMQNEIESLNVGVAYAVIIYTLKNK